MTALAAPTRTTSRLPGPSLAWVIGGHLVVSALAGIVWWAWAPTPSLSYKIPNGSSVVTIPDETENQVAADGRFLVIVLVLGIAVALVLWRLRPVRGPVAVVAAAVLGVLGAEITSLVGSSLSSPTAVVQSTFTPALDLHATVMIVAEGFIAVLVVTIAALASSDEHLGRPPARDSEQAAGLEHGGGGGNGAQLPHQFQFPAQDPPGGA